MLRRTHKILLLGLSLFFASGLVCGEEKPPVVDAATKAEIAKHLGVIRREMSSHEMRSTLGEVREQLQKVRAQTSTKSASSGDRWWGVSVSGNDLSAYGLLYLETLVDAKLYDYQRKAYIDRLMGALRRQKAMLNKDKKKKETFLAAPNLLFLITSVRAILPFKETLVFTAVSFLMRQLNEKMLGMDRFPSNALGLMRAEDEKRVPLAMLRPLVRSFFLGPATLLPAALTGLAIYKNPGRYVRRKIMLQAHPKRLAMVAGCWFLSAYCLFLYLMLSRSNFLLTFLKKTSNWSALTKEYMEAPEKTLRERRAEKAFRTALEVAYGEKDSMAKKASWSYLVRFFTGGFMKLVGGDDVV